MNLVAVGIRLFCVGRVSQTYPGPIEAGGQHQHDVVGPVLLVHGHLVLFDHQDVEVRRSVHGVVQVEQTVLVAAGGYGEDRTLDAVWTLEKQVEEDALIRFIHYTFTHSATEQTVETRHTIMI